MLYRMVILNVHQPLSDNVCKGIGFFPINYFYIVTL
jgi:hypothetical protein